MLGITGKWGMVNGHDESERRIGGRQFSPEPIDLILMKLSLGFTDIGKKTDDRRHRGSEGPIDVRQIHLCAARSGLERTQLIRIARHEVLDPPIERGFIRVYGAILGIVRLAVMVARNGDDEPRIVLIRGVKIIAILVDIAGKIDHIAEMVEEGRGFAGWRVVAVLCHHLRDKVLLLTSKIPGIPHGVEDQNACIPDILEICRGEQLGEVKPKGRLAIGRRERLKGKIRSLKAGGLRRESRTVSWGEVALSIARTSARCKGIKGAHDNLLKLSKQFTTILIVQQTRQLGRCFGPPSNGKFFSLVEICRYITPFASLVGAHTPPPARRSSHGPPASAPRTPPRPALPAQTRPPALVSHALWAGGGNRALHATQPPRLLIGRIAPLSPHGGPAMRTLPARGRR